MPCPLCHTLEQVRANAEHRHIARLSVSHLLLAEDQGCPGWCVVVLDSHEEHLEMLEPGRREALLDVAAAGAALKRSLDVPRINYACLCNVVPHLHWHLIPRRASDPAGAVWSWPETRQRGSVSAEERAALAARIRDSIR